MKRKHRKISNSISKEETIPDWLGGEDLNDPPDVDELEGELDDDDLPANVEKGIRDLPVWKDLVARVGLQEARNILRRGLMVNRIINGNPDN
jgi:hypothetical protein